MREIGPVCARLRGERLRASRLRALLVSKGNMGGPAIMYSKNFLINAHVVAL